MAHRIRSRIAPLARRMDLRNLIWLSGQSDIFPFYHVVSDWHLPHIRHLYRYKRVKEFESDLDEMLKWYRPVGLQEYIDSMKKEGARGRGGADRTKKMVLTFDDGLIECHQTIAPLLLKKGVPAAFFLNNYFIDNRGLFYRYKASMIIDQVISDCKSREKAAAYLSIPEKQVGDAIRMIHHGQQALLDELARQLEVDVVDYLREHPVYMDSSQVKDLRDWGFEIGGHSPDHADFSTLEPDRVISQVKESIDDLQQRFGATSRLFSFPFTSQGVPEQVIDSLLEEQVADVLLGTAGLKKTGKAGLIQRIPMEEFEKPALEALKTEYLYYLIKKPFGKNRMRY